ncbi:MAG: fluoride efflux transporter CrcB [Gammaproteobacteria bacterium]|nr:fluoride efflux transporter CrcB [Gammaproteobacteria bacterium]
MTQLIAIAAGGAAGSLLRFWMSSGVHALAGRQFPYGTLAVNVLGCLLMGILFVLLTERLNLGPVWRAGLLIGLLGGFTTFSAFSMETINLIEEGAPLKASLNVLLSVFISLAATWLGVVAGRQL